MGLWGFMPCGGLGATLFPVSSEERGEQFYLRKFSLALGWETGAQGRARWEVRTADTDTRI